MRRLTLTMVGIASLGLAGCGATQEQLAEYRSNRCQEAGLAEETQEFRECMAKQVHRQHAIGAGAPLRFRRHSWTHDIIEN